MRAARRLWVSRPVSGQLSLSTPGQKDVSRPVGASASMDAPSTASDEAPPQVVHTVAEEVRKVQLVVVKEAAVRLQVVKVRRKEAAVRLQVLLEMFQIP